MIKFEVFYCCHCEERKRRGNLKTRSPRFARDDRKSSWWFAMTKGCIALLGMEELL